MLGTIVGILFLVALLVLFVASVQRIVVTYRDQRKADIVAIISLLLVLLIFACVILLILGPVIDPAINGIPLWSAE